MPELLTVTQVAELLRVHKQTVRNWIGTGLLPARHIGRRVRIDRKDLDGFIAAGATTQDAVFWGEQAKR